MWLNPIHPWLYPLISVIYLYVPISSIVLAAGGFICNLLLALSCRPTYSLSIENVLSTSISRFSTHILPFVNAIIHIVGFYASLWTFLYWIQISTLATLFMACPKSKVDVATFVFSSNSHRFLPWQTQGEQWSWHHSQSPLFGLKIKDEDLVATLVVLVCSFISNTMSIQKFK